jgi:putative transposase
MEEYRHHRHSVFRLTYHLVLVTKYRHKCITPVVLADLIDTAGTTLEKLGCRLVEANGEDDHLHLLIETNPAHAPAVVVNSLKTVTSRLIRKKHAVYLGKFYWKPFFWEQSYFIVTTGGASIEAVRKYIESQGKEPSQLSPPNT